MKTGFKTFITLELQDASKINTHIDYHQSLNPALWASSGDTVVLKDDVREALLKIAQEFIQFLELIPGDIKDIILTGSNANYNWTELSDVDLHIVADFSDFAECKMCQAEFINTCFQAKKTLWNNSHNITIKGFPVEVYVQNEKEPLIATGVFSLTQNKWTVVPQYKEATYNTTSVKLKAAEIMNQIDSIIDNKSDDIDDLEKIKAKIKAMRQSGLQKAGEFGIENLTFKTLRNNGYLDKLSDYLATLKDQSLSLA